MTDPGDAPADPPVSSENVTMDIDSNPTPQPTDPSQSAPSDPVLATSEGITASSLTEPSSTQPQPTSEATPPSTEPATAPTSSSDVPPPAPSSDRREGEDEEDSPSELELYKAAHLKKEVDQEQAVSDALEKVSQLEKQLANERKRKDDGVSREDGLAQSLQHLQKSHADLQQSLSSKTAEATLHQTELSSLQSQNRSLLSTISTYKEERDQASSDARALKEKVASWERRVEEVEGELESRRGEGRNFKFKVEALELNLELANKDNLALSDSLSRLTSEFAKYRSNSQSQSSTLQLEIQSLQSQLSTSQTSLAHLTASQTSLSSRLTDSLSTTASLRSQLAEQKSTFRQEMTVQERLLDSAERRAEEGRKRLEEVEREWEEDLERRREAEKRVEEERRDWERAREEYEKKVGELRETVDTLVEANAASGVAGGGGFEEGASLLSPMAGLANSLMRKKGQSISDLYVENVRVKSQLTQAQLEKSRLEDMMSDVLRQIQEKAPALKEQTQAYHKLQDVASQLAAQLATVTHERDSQLSQIASLISQSKTAQSSLSELETHLSDLSRQVIILTREVALRDSPSLAQALERERDGEVENGENDGSMDSVITQNLITFRSIPELQQQNQKLVKIVRELGRKLEAVETNGGRIGGEAQGEGSDEAMKMVDEANELISALKSKLEAKSVQMDKAIRERDMFSRMLSQAGVSLPASLEMDSNGAGGGGVGGSLLDVVKANLDAYRVELGLDGDRLRKELDETRRELGALGGELAKVSAERDWHKQRIAELNEALELQKVEFKGVVQQSQTLKDDLTRVNIELRMAENKRIDAESVAERARMEAANIRAEKLSWKSHEERLLADLSSSSKDRASQQLLIANLRTIETEASKTLEEARARSDAEMAGLQTERSKLRDELAALRSQQVADSKSISAERIRLQAEKDQAVSGKEAVEANLSQWQEKFKRQTSTFQDHSGKMRAEKNELSVLVKTLRDETKALKDELEKTKASAGTSGGAPSGLTQALTADLNRVRQEKGSAEARLRVLEDQLKKTTGLAVERDNLAREVESLKAAGGPPSGSSDASQEQINTLIAERDELKKQLEATGSSETPSDVAPERLAELESERTALAEKISNLEAAQKETELAHQQAVAKERNRNDKIFRDNKRYIKEEKPAFQAAEQALKDEVAALQAQLVEAQAAAVTTSTSSSDPSSSDPAFAPPPPPSEKLVQTAVQEALAKLESSHAEALAAQERKVREELASTLQASSTPIEPSREAIDAAVEAALNTKESELQKAHSEALAEREKALREEMRVAIEEASAITIESHSKTTSPEDVEAAVKAAVAARESELVALHEAALQAAAASSSSSSFVDPEVQKAEIEEAVKAAVAKALAAAQSEHASKAATQKGMLERQRTTIATLKAENAKLKEGVAVDPATPAAAAATPIARQPSIGKAGLPANPAKTKAAGQPPTGPAASTPQTTLGGPGPGTTTRAKAAAASAPQVVPTAATGGIKGAATAGRGGGAAGRGGAIAGRGGRGGNRAAGLFAGAMNQVGAAPGGAKRARDSDGEKEGSLLDRLAAAQPNQAAPKPVQIKRVKRDPDSSAGGDGSAGGGAEGGEGGGGGGQAS